MLHKCCVDHLESWKFLEIWKFRIKKYETDHTNVGYRISCKICIELYVLNFLLRFLFLVIELDTFVGAMF